MTVLPSKISLWTIKSRACARLCNRVRTLKRRVKTISLQEPSIVGYIFVTFLCFYSLLNIKICVFNILQLYCSLNPQYSRNTHANYFLYFYLFDLLETFEVLTVLLIARAQCPGLLLDGPNIILNYRAPTRTSMN